MSRISGDMEHLCTCKGIKKVKATPADKKPKSSIWTDELNKLNSLIKKEKGERTDELPVRKY